MSKYKIGDKVRIKSIEWYNQNKDSFGLVLSDNDTNVFCYNMQKHCGEELTVRHISENGRYDCKAAQKRSGSFHNQMMRFIETELA